MSRGLRSIQDFIIAGEIPRASYSSEPCVLFFSSETVVTRINHPHVL